MDKKARRKVWMKAIAVIITASIVLFLAYVIALGAIFSKGDLEVKRAFYSPDNEFVVVDCTDTSFRDINGYLHIYKTAEYDEKGNSNNREVYKILNNYSDFDYGGPYLVYWIDNDRLRIDDKCFSISQDKYLDNYMPEYPFVSICEFYSPDKKYVVVDCITESDTLRLETKVFLYETENYISYLFCPEKQLEDENYLYIISDENGNFGTAYGGRPNRIKWLSNTLLRIENAEYDILKREIARIY